MALSDSSTPKTDVNESPFKKSNHDREGLTLILVISLFFLREVFEVGCLHCSGEGTVFW